MVHGADGFLQSSHHARHLRGFSAPVSHRKQLSLLQHKPQEQLDECSLALKYWIVTEKLVERCPCKFRDHHRTSRKRSSVPVACGQLRLQCGLAVVVLAAQVNDDLRARTVLMLAKCVLR